jgi:exodeoxyribonuclease VII large subunit
LGLRVFEPQPASSSWSVAALLQAASDALAARLSSCRVQGEISAFTQAASGHCYFTLKDSSGAAAAVRCVMFRRAAAMSSARPQDGQQVQVLGRMSVYEPRGDMQFVVEAMQPLGAGALYEQFLRLKAKLEAEGLFDAARKRALPRVPTCVGLVTSTAGAALHDMLTTFARRSPWLRLVVYPSLVQGAGAPAALVRALRTAAQRQEVDVLIVARGGGSLEDLWAFNDEQVVRAVASLPMPVISGVGHETDVTLCDLAADLRAATPTAAAQQAAPDVDDELAALNALQHRQALRLHQRLDAMAQRLDQQAARLLRPSGRIAQQRQRLDQQAFALQQAGRSCTLRQQQQLDQWALRLPQALRQPVTQAHNRLAVQQGRLAALDPRRVLQRGYAWVSDAQGRALTHAAQVQAGQRITTHWSDGSADATVDTVTPQPPPSART